MLEIPRALLYAGILVFGTLGVYSLSGSVVEVLVMYAIGVLGFFMRRYDFPIAPVILGVILGPLMETQARRALTASGDDFGVFFGRPLTVVPAAGRAWPRSSCRTCRRCGGGWRSARTTSSQPNSQDRVQGSPSACADAGAMTATTQDDLRAAPRARAVSLPRSVPSSWRCSCSRAR